MPVFGCVADPKPCCGWLISTRHGKSDPTGMNVCFGSKADEMYVSASRPLHLTSPTCAEAGLNVCDRPQADAGGVQRSRRMRLECAGVPDSSSAIQAVEVYCCRSVRTAIASGTPMNAPGIPHSSAAKKTAKTTRNGEIEKGAP